MGEQATKEKAEEYPEHAKLIALNGQNQIIGQFIEWLHDQGVTPCRWREAGNNGEPRHLYRDDKPELDEMSCWGGEWHRDSSGRYFRDNPDHESWGAGWEPVFKTIPAWLAEYFGIDQAALDREKDAMLAAIRAANAKPPANHPPGPPEPPRPNRPREVA